MLTNTAVKAVKLMCQSFNEEQLKIMQAKIFETLKNSQPHMKVYYLLEKTGAVVKDAVAQ